jgi:Zn-dependent M28 family amino/carboxypeptidase
MNGMPHLGIDMIITKMPGVSYQGGITPLSEYEKGTQERLHNHVFTLSETIGERHIDAYENLKRAAHYITAEFKNAGYKPQKQTYTAEGKAFDNIWVEQRGTTHPENILIIGAHYDTVPNTPGADDNASGIACLLELARECFDQETGCTVRFVAFVNEEPPFCHTEQMGSYVYAKACKDRQENIIGMISLEMLGFYSDEANSQDYPPEIAKLYPNQGNFIAFVGNPESQEFFYKVITLFRQTAQIPSEGLIAPTMLPVVDLSDQWSFWQMGYPAIMLTDTAFYRNHHYHNPRDTIEKLNFASMTKITMALSKLFNHL